MAETYSPGLVKVELKPVLSHSNPHSLQALGKQGRYVQLCLNIITDSILIGDHTQQFHVDVKRSGKSVEAFLLPTLIGNIL